MREDLAATGFACFTGFPATDFAFLAGFAATDFSALVFAFFAGFELFSETAWRTSTLKADSSIFAP